MNYATSFPVLTGEVITQGHADYCEINGHATHKVDGVTSLVCPRCGNVSGMTYAEYLNTMTVKSLREIARQAGISGYTKLRKAGLVIVIDVATTTAHIAAIREAAQIAAEPTMDRVRTLMSKAIEANRSVAQSAYRVWLATDDESAYQLYLDADLMARSTQRAFHHGYPGVI